MNIEFVLYRIGLGMNWAGVALVGLAWDGKPWPDPSPDFWQVFGGVQPELYKGIPRHWP